MIEWKGVPCELRVDGEFLVVMIDGYEVAIIGREINRPQLATDEGRPFWSSVGTVRNLFELNSKGQIALGEDRRPRRRRPHRLAR